MSVPAEATEEWVAPSGFWEIQSFARKYMAAMEALTELAMSAGTQDQIIYVNVLISVHMLYENQMDSLLHTNLKQSVKHQEWQEAHKK